MFYEVSPSPYRDVRPLDAVPFPAWAFMPQAEIKDVKAPAGETVQRPRIRAGAGMVYEVSPSPYRDVRPLDAVPFPAWAFMPQAEIKDPERMNQPRAGQGL